MSLNQSQKEFPYEVRVSPRARRVKLAFKPYRGLEVVIPQRFPRREIPRILQQHGDWIRKQFEQHGHSLLSAAPPEQIEFALTCETFSVNFHSPSRNNITETEDHLQVDCENSNAGIKLLRNWLRKKATRTLKPLLHEVSLDCGLCYSKCTVRGQKSRWGSCSGRGGISLNEQLLFMPPQTVRYLMIHELCHTRHLNHSAAFWTLVESFEPNYLTHERALDQGRERIPAWYLQSLYGR